MLSRKMIRDMWGNRGTYIACIVIMAIGLTIYNVFGIAYNSIETSIQEFYSEQKFADGFAEVVAMPLGELSSLRGIDKIKEVDGRLIKDVKILNNDNELKGYLRLISYREDANLLNKFEVINGDIPSSNGKTIILGSKYFNANKIALNDNIRVLINGSLFELTVSGSCRSPEFVYALRSDQDIYPDPEYFGIAYMPYDQLQNMLQTGPIINDITFTISDGGDFRDIKYEVNERLEQYGIVKLYGRKDQSSHLMLRGEVDGLREISKSLPIVFLLIAGAILIIMLKRLIENQRIQVGVLKAFGYKNNEVLIHYISYAMIVGICGGSIGGVLGNVCVKPLMLVYQSFFNMPLSFGGFSPLYFVKGILMSMGVSLIAGYFGAKNVIKLAPAEAMKPAAPKSINKTWIERLTVVWSRLTMIQRIALRNIFRNKGRSLFLLIGIIFTIGILGMPYALKININKMIYNQFENVMLYDARVNLESPKNRKQVINELAVNPYVEKVESYVEVPAELSLNGKKKLVNIIGIESNSQLYNLVDDSGNKVMIKDDGMWISQRLGEYLGINEGDTIQIKSPYSNSKNRESRVIIKGLIPQYLGLNAYMEERALMKLLNQSEFTTSALIKMPANKIDIMKKTYENSAQINSVEAKEDIRIKYNSLMGMMSSVLIIFIIVGMLSGFAIIYASSMITMSERQRELASMLVIGMSYKEVRKVLYLEQWYIAAIGLVLSLPLLKGMIEVISSSLGNDVYNFPSEMGLGSVLSAAILSAISIGIAQYGIRNKLNKIKLVEALSMRE